MSERPDLALELVEALATVEGVPAHELPYSLHNHVNTAVVEGLGEMSNPDWTFTVRIADHDVTLTGDGEIAIDGDVVRTVESVPSGQS